MYLECSGQGTVLHSYYIVEWLLIYLSFLKIVHHCSSLLGSNSKGTQKIGRLNIRKKFTESWVFNILKRDSTIPPNEEIIRHNICNVKLQPNICDI